MCHKNCQGWQFYGHFGLWLKCAIRTAKVSSLLTKRLHGWKVSSELPRSAVLRRLIKCHQNCSWEPTKHLLFSQKMQTSWDLVVPSSVKADSNWKIFGSNIYFWTNSIFWVEIFFWSKQIFKVEKKFQVKKCFGSNNFDLEKFGPKKFAVNNFLGQHISLDQFFLAPNSFFWVKHSFNVEFLFG